MKKLLLTFVCLLAAIGIASAADNVKTEAMYRAAANVGQLADDMKAWPDAVNPLSLDFASAGLSWDGTSNIRGGYLYWNAGNTMTLTPKEGYKVVGLKVGGYLTSCSDILASATASSGTISVDVGSGSMVWTGDLAAGSTLTIKSNATTDAYAIYVVVSYEQEGGGTGGDVIPGEKEFVFTSNTDYKYTGESPSKSWEDQNLNSNPVLTNGEFSMTWPNYTLSNSSTGYFYWSGTNTTCTVTAKPGVTVTEIVFHNTPNGSGAAEMYDYVKVSSGTKSQGGSTGEDFVWKGTCDVNNPLTLTKQAGKLQVGEVQYIVVKYEVAAVTTVDKPTFTSDGGSVDQFSQVEIKAMTGATIEYCLSQDGSENWVSYTAPVTLTEAGNWTLKARATYNGVTSDVAEANFTVNALTKISSGFAMSGTKWGAVAYQGEYPVTMYSSDLTEVVAEGCAKLTWSDGGISQQSTFFNINANGQIIVTPDKGTTITKVIFGGYDNYNYGLALANLVPSVGDALTNEGYEYIWTGNSTETVTFTAPAKCSYVCYIAVEYTKDLTGGGDEPAGKDKEIVYQLINSPMDLTVETTATPINLWTVAGDLKNDGSYAKDGMIVSWKNLSGDDADYGVSINRGSEFTFKPEGDDVVKKVIMQFYSDSSIASTINDGMTANTGTWAATGVQGICGMWEGEATNANPLVLTVAGLGGNYPEWIVVEYGPKGAAETVADPAISPEKGTYKVGQLVTITAEDGATVQYSVAATDATGTTVTWREYTEPFALEAGNWTVSAKAVKGSVESQVVSVEYTVNKEACVLSFAEESYAAVMGQTFESPAVVNEANLTLTWSSNNDRVATVDNTGKVTLVGAGTAVIKAAFAGDANTEAGEATYTLTVARQVPDFKFATDKAEYTFGGAEFTAPVLTNNTNLPVQWTSSNEAVATVDNTGKVTFVGAGETIIKAVIFQTSVYEGAEATYTVTVKRQNPDFKFATDKAEYTFGTEFTAPELTNTQNLEVTWSSSNEEVATVDAEGKVTFVAAGEVTIKATGAQSATCEGAEASYTVTVNRQDAEFKFSAESVELTIDDEFKAPELINPANLEVTWSSSNEEVVTVDAEGKVTVKAAGEAVIKAVGAENGKYNAAEAEYKVIVKTSGIRGITIDDTENAIYTLNGVRVSGEELTPGIYILVKDGKVTKIAVK